MPQRLRAQVRRRVHEHAEVIVELEIDGGARAFVARVGGPADVAIAADHRHARRGAGSEEDHAHAKTDASMNANGEACTAAHRTVEKSQGRKVEEPPGRNVEQSARGRGVCAAGGRHGDTAIAARLSVGPRADAGHAAAVPARGDVRSARSDRSRRLRGSPRRARRRRVSVRVPGADRGRGRAIRDGRRARRGHGQADPPSPARVHAGRPAARGATPAAPRRRPRRCSSSGSRSRRRNRHAAGAKTRLLSGVPRSLPALLRAHEIGTRVAAVGFDWARHRRRARQDRRRGRRAARGALDQPSARGRGIRRPALLDRESRAQAQHRARVRAPRGQ